eukprot:6195457-Pleurochrysis_carterae.AAC.3
MLGAVMTYVTNETPKSFTLVIVPVLVCVVKCKYALREGSTAELACGHSHFRVHRKLSSVTDTFGRLPESVCSNSGLRALHLASALRRSSAAARYAPKPLHASLAASRQIRTQNLACARRWHSLLEVQGCESCIGGLEAIARR